MKSICLFGLVICAACGGANAVGGSQSAKNDVASSAGQSDTTPTFAKDGGSSAMSDKPAPAPAKDGGSGGW